MRGVRIVWAVMLLSGCYATASPDQLVHRAAFDFGCAASGLKVVDIDESTEGVVGCGRRGTYVQSCDGPRNRLDTTCTWVLNGRLEANEQPAPGPAPAADRPVADRPAAPAAQ
jgi:hypothetical protein